MYNNVLSNLQNMSINEIEKQLEQFEFTEAELCAVNSGKETIDNMLKLNSDSSSKVGWYIVLYTLYKLNGANNIKNR